MGNNYIKIHITLKIIILKHRHYIGIWISNGFENVINNKYKILIISFDYFQNIILLITITCGQKTTIIHGP